MIDKTKLPDCPVETTLLFLGDKWKILIYRELRTSTKRFNELVKALAPISQKVLTSNLRALEQNNVISRKVYPVVPPKVEYSLTEFGETLFPILDAMDNWGKTYKQSVKK